MLQGLGVAIDGEIKVGKCPESSKMVASHLSPSLEEIISHMLKDSDNLYADMLFKKVGSVKLGKPGTWQKGSKAVRSFLTDVVKINTDKLVILDGCGLSRYNLSSPHQYAEYLTWVLTKAPFKERMERALPKAGIEGTLESRMQGLTSNLRAKTGSMTGVSGLSGFLTTKEGKHLVFAILTGGFTESTKVVKTQVEDPICTLLADFSESKPNQK